MTLPPFNQQFLDGAKPDGIEAMVLQLQQDLDATKKRVLQLESLEQAAQLTGSLNVSGDGTVTAGGAALTEDGAMLNGPSDMAVNFWASIGVPSNVVTQIYALAFWGNALFVGGSFTKIGGLVAANHIAQYDVSTGVWSNVGTPTALNAPVLALTLGSGYLYIGGNFTGAGGVAAADYIVRWNGSTWSAMGTNSINSAVLAIATSGTNVYVGGNFTNASGISGANRIALWNGSAWSAMGSSSINSTVLAIAIIGTNVYVGGGFINADGIAAADYIAMWNGSAWSALGSGLSSMVYGMAVSDTDLYVVGDFTAADGGSADKIARWDGAAWYAVGNIVFGLGSVIYAIVISGTNIYIGGTFSVYNVSDFNYVARWDGTNWYALGNDILSDVVQALAAKGNDLYVGGVFTTISGRSSKAIAAYLSSLQSVLQYLEISEQALQDSLINGSVPLPGSITAYAGRAAPSGYLICDGSAVSRATYPNLAAAIMPRIGTFSVTIASPGVFTLTAHGLSTADAVYLTTTGALPTGLSQNTVYYAIRINANTFNLALSRSAARAGAKINTTGSQSGTHTLAFCPFGLGDGSTTFNVPDMRHAVAGGLDTGDTNFDVLGLAGGEETHTLTSGEMPSHTHTQNSHNHTQDPHSHDFLTRDNSAIGATNRQTNSSAAGTTRDISGLSPTTATNQAATAVNQNTGGGGAHNNLQPYLTLNYIIKT